VLIYKPVQVKAVNPPKGETKCLPDLNQRIKNAVLERDVLPNQRNRRPKGPAFQKEQENIGRTTLPPKRKVAIRDSQLEEAFSVKVPRAMLRLHPAETRKTVELKAGARTVKRTALSNTLLNRLAYRLALLGLVNVDTLEERQEPNL
jgi:hypothetical protein